MRKTRLFIFMLILLFSCDSKEKNKTVDPNTTQLPETDRKTQIVSQNEEEYTFDRFKDEFNEAFMQESVPIGTCFWDEFKEMETWYGLTSDESRLLGEWFNITLLIYNPNSPIGEGLNYNSYYFYPNKLFILDFNYNNFLLTNEKYFDKAIGTWDIIDGIVQITIFAIVIRTQPPNTSIFFIEQPYTTLFVDRPYTINFINIEDIGEEGFTKRPINDAILSDELRQMVWIKEPNRTNNLYVRNIYTVNYITNSGSPEKNYGHFRNVREMARENHSGLDIVTNSELIERYIFSIYP